MSTCLVTGGAGFIGCALSKDLADTFANVVAFDNLLPQVHAQQKRPEDLDPRVQLVVGDVSEESDWDKLLATVKPDVIVHLAAETGTGQSLLEASKHSLANVVGTTRMTDALVRNKCVPKKIVLASSRAVYGEGIWINEAGQECYPGGRTHEMLEAGSWEFPGLTPLVQASHKVKPDPSNVYAATKLCQENLLTSWCGSMGVELVRFRLQNVYGAGQSLSNPYTGIVSLFCRLAKAGETIPVYEDGIIVRDFVYIDDVANAIFRGVTVGTTNKYPYDIGIGRRTTIIEVAKIIANRYGAPEPQINGMFRDGDVRAAWADITAAKQDLGWQPQVTLEEGIEKLCTWIDQQL